MKLTGSELISKTKELKGVSESEKVLACGYFSTSKNGKKRKNYNAYYKAIAEAQGYKSSGENDPGVITWTPSLLKKAKDSGMVLLDDNSLIDLDKNRLKTIIRESYVEANDTDGQKI